MMAVASAWVSVVEVPRGGGLTSVTASRNPAWVCHPRGLGNPTSWGAPSHARTARLLPMGQEHSRFGTKAKLGRGSKPMRAAPAWAAAAAAAPAPVAPMNLPFSPGDFIGAGLFGLLLPLLIGLGAVYILFIVKPDAVLTSDQMVTFNKLERKRELERRGAKDTGDGVPTNRDARRRALRNKLRGGKTEDETAKP